MNWVLRAHNIERSLTEDTILGGDPNTPWEITGDCGPSEGNFCRIQYFAEDCAVDTYDPPGYSVSYSSQGWAITEVVNQRYCLDVTASTNYLFPSQPEPPSHDYFSEYEWSFVSDSCGKLGIAVFNGENENCIQGSFDYSNGEIIWTGPPLAPACPPGTVQCFDPEDPTKYCCLPCKEVKSQINIIANLIKYG